MQGLQNLITAKATSQIAEIKAGQTNVPKSYNSLLFQ